MTTAALLFLVIMLGAGALAGWLAGWRIHRPKGVGPPTPTVQLIEFDQSLRQALAAKRAENARLHAEWDRDARLATPPARDAVWKRRIYDITDFNN